MLGLHFSPRRVLIIAHGLVERRDSLFLFPPGFIVYAGFVYFLFHLYEAKRLTRVGRILCQSGN
jgi:hypothetical protein